MKLPQLLLFAFLMLVFAQPAHAVFVVKPNPENQEAKTTETTVTPEKELTSKEKRQLKKKLRKEIKSTIKDARKGNKSDVSNTFLLVLITILIPPLGVALHEGGITNRFWISLLLTILFYIPGLIYSLIVVLE